MPVLFSMGEGAVHPYAQVRWNGDPVEPGLQAVGGLLGFKDGGRADLVGHHRLELLSSFKIDNGKCYSVVRVPDGYEGTIKVQATPGSRFEVLTPAAVAVVEGTRFRVVTGEGAVSGRCCPVVRAGGVVSCGRPRTC